jgi:3-oxoadipate enol-lactonase
VSPAPVHHRVEDPPPAGAAAPLLVLSHSLGATLEAWDPQIAGLGPNFRVVRYDLRGHGRSPSVPGSCDIADLGADLLGLLDRIGARRAHLCGLSLGAMVSLWVAAHHPERVERLVLCCTTAHFSSSAPWVERAAIVRASGTAGVADAVVTRWFTPEFGARHPELVASMRAMIAATSAEGYAACCDAIGRMDLRADLGAIRAPTLIIAAADDTAIPPEHSFAIARAIPDGRVEVVASAAHLANVEQPRRVTELILSHLKENP